MKKAFKVLPFILCIAMLLTACSGKAGSTSSQSTSGLTTTARTTITIYVDYEKVYLSNLLKEMISNFPQYKFEIRLLQANVTREELQREMLHNDTVDIIFSSALDPNMEGLDIGCADLSAKSYCSRYKPVYLKDVETDGKIYMLPLASVLDGIVYNKTLFDENGWTVPKNYDEYVALCDKIIAAGYGVEGEIPSNNQTAKAFKRLYMLDAGHNLSAYRWLTEFNDGTASIYDIDWTATLDDFDESCDLRERSRQFKLTGESFNSVSEMANRDYALMEVGSNLLAQVGSGGGDEFRLMPFFGSESDGGWLFNSGYIKMAASSKAMADPQKTEAIDKVFSFFSSDAGQALINEYTFNIIAPTVGGTPQIDADLFADVREEIEQGRILDYDSMQNCDSVLGDMVYAYMDGAFSRKDLLDGLEKVNEDGSGQDDVIAEATDDFTRDDMSSLLLTALRSQTGSDFSLLSKDVESLHLGNVPIAQRYLMGTLYRGDITELDLSCCIQVSHTEDYDPNYQPTSLVLYTMTGRQILGLLEYGKDVYIGGGLRMIYTWDADKNTYLATGFIADNGKSFDLDTEYTVSSLSLVPVGENYYQSVEDTGIGYYHAVRDWLIAQKSVSPTALEEPVLQGK